MQKIIWPRLKSSKVRTSTIFLLPIFIIILGVFFGGLNVNKANADAKSTLYFLPSSTTVVTSSDFSLDARINPISGGTANQIAAVEIHVLFDPNKLQLLGVDSTASPASPFSVILQHAVINNTTGKASIILGVPTPDNPDDPPLSVTTDAKIATFHFHPLSAGDSSVSFDNSAGSLSRAAALDTTGDVVTTRTPAAITVTSGSTTTYTVTASAGDHGSISPGSRTVSSGSTTTFTVTPDAAYTVSVGGTCGGTLVGTTYTTHAITADCSVNATFSDVTGPTFTINDGISSTPVKSDTINITVIDAGTGVASESYGFSSDDNCTSDDTITTDFTSGSDFTISGNHSDYLCVAATDNSGNTSYQLVGQLHTDNTAPTISAEAAHNLAATSAKIIWTTDENADSQVEYGATTGYGSSTTLGSTLTQSHSQNLSGLDADTDYHYRVKSADAAGNLATGDDHTFHTASSSQVELPVADPGGGEYSSTQSVSLSTGTSGATIYYTINGDDPTASSTAYSSAIKVDSDMTIKALAAKDGSSNSNIMEEDYTIDDNSADTGNTNISRPKIRINLTSKTLTHSKIMYSKSKSFKLKGSDHDLAGGKINIYKDGHLWKSVTADADGSWGKSVKVDDNKDYKFKFHYYNQSGDDLGTSSSYKVRVDSEKPEITNLPLLLHKRAGDKVWWTAKDNDKIDYYKYVINGKTVKTSDDSFIMPSLSWGMHVLYVSAYDKAGNKTTKKVAIIVI